MENMILDFAIWSIRCMLIGFLGLLCKIANDGLKELKKQGEEQVKQGLLMREIKSELIEDLRIVEHRLNEADTELGRRITDVALACANRHN